MPTPEPTTLPDGALRVLVTGSSGLIGRSLMPVLASRACRVTRLVHGRAGAPGDIAWGAGVGEPAFPVASAYDAVIHLAGENVAGGRWTPARRAAIRESRVAGTRNLVAALARLPAPPRVFVSAGAIGYYGDRGEEALPESAAPGTGFLAETCVAWEREVAAAARSLGARCVIGRIGVVLSGAGGTLGQMLPIFRAGLGGPLAGGRQWMSWVSAQDVVAMLVTAVLDDRWSGPVNFVAPGAVTNAAFTETLAHRLHRPAFLPVPRWMLRARFGAMADEMLLASTRVVPQALAAHGFAWAHPQLDSALRAALGGDGTSPGWVTQ
jgi:uncharacterized protein (TIGR01777 family)